jgi:O-antigen/teichoic acid export membrane protein
VFEPLGDSLKKITRGAGIAMVGMVIGLLLQFITRPIIARYGLETNYGIFSLALAILSMFTMLACLGLNHGATRYIAYFRAREEATKVRGTISASLQLSSAASFVIGIILFFCAERISINIFHTPDLVLALRIFAIGIPFFTLINILTSIFRGFDEVKPQVYFYYILLNSLFLLLLLAVILSGLPFVAAFYAYLAALVLTFIATITYTTKKLPQRLTFVDGKTATSVRKELLNFSLPLLLSTMLVMIMMWTDTLMLGSLKTPEAVGLYNAAYPLAQFISMPMNALVLIYSPVVSGLYSLNLLAELRHVYATLTKWLTFITLPVFLILCLFPEAVLNLIFGPAYSAAAPALRILSFGFMVNNLAGPNTATLIAMGKTRFIMWASLTAATVNVLLNITLIPPLGIIGAAIASAVSLILVNIIVTAKVHSLCQAQPLSKNLLKPVITSVVLALLFRVTIGSFLTVTLWMLPLLFILYYAIYAIAIVFTRSFDKSDIALLLEIERRSGLNTTPIKKILSRFVRL